MAARSSRRASMLRAACTATSGAGGNSSRRQSEAFASLSSQSSRRIDPASHGKRPQNVAVPAEGSLERFDGGARRRQRSRRVDRREADLDLSHVLDGIDDLAARGVLETAFLDLVRVLGLGFFVLDLTSHQEHEVRAHGSLLGRDVPDFPLERGAVERALARPQPFQLEDDHLLAEGVALSIGRQLEPGERDLAGTRHLDEERLRRREPGITRPLVAADDAVDHGVAGCEAERRESEIRPGLPCAAAFTRDGQGKRSLVELELLAGTRDLGVAQLERLEPEVVGCRCGKTDDGRGVGQQEIFAWSLHTNRRSTIGNHRHRKQSPRRARVAILGLDRQVAAAASGPGRRQSSRRTRSRQAHRFRSARATARRPAPSGSDGCPAAPRRAPGFGPSARARACRREERWWPEQSSRPPRSGPDALDCLLDGTGRPRVQHARTRP